MAKRFLLLLIILPLWLQADSVYKWVDEKGVVHFSFKPHHQADDVEMVDASESPRVGGDSWEQDSRDNNESTEAAEEVVDNSAPTPEQLEYCKALKNNLKTLKTSPRVKRQKANGEYEVLGDEARQSEIDRIEKSLKESCQ